MKVYEILNERVSSVLFHVIDFPGAESMLKQDKFRQKDVSFTRSLTGEYHLGNKIIGVVFQFDGDLLNQKFKGGPVGTEDWDLDDKLTYRGKENKQLEDRINTKEGLTEVTKYIKNAVLFCPKEFVEDDSEDGFGISYRDSVTHIAKVGKLLSAKKIPVRYVSTVKELFNKSVNNKQGFLEAVAIVDEDAARNLGLKITKQYETVLQYIEYTEDGPIIHDNKKIHITADSQKAAEQQANEAATELTQKYHKMFGEDDSAEWEAFDVNEID